jgi:hypothetical protein
MPTSDLFSTFTIKSVTFKNGAVAGMQLAHAGHKASTKYGFTSAGNAPQSLLAIKSGEKTSSTRYLGVTICKGRSS